MSGSPIYKSEPVPGSLHLSNLRLILIPSKFRLHALLFVIRPIPDRNEVFLSFVRVRWKPESHSIIYARSIFNGSYWSLT